MSKLTKIIVTSIFSAILALGGIWYAQKKYNSLSENQVGALKDFDRNLSKESEKIYYERIKKAEEHLKSLKPGDKDYKLQIINDSNYLAQQYFGLGKLEKSKSYYFDILKIEPKTEFALVGLAYVYTEAGEKGTAIEIIKSAIDNNPTNYNLWIQYLDLQKSAEMNNGDLDKIFNTALEKTGRHINLVVKYAVFMESIGNIPKAISLWEEAIKQNPEMVELYKEEILRLKQINNSK